MYRKEGTLSLNRLYQASVITGIAGLISFFVLAGVLPKTALAAQGDTTRVSVEDTSGDQSTGESAYASISSDGRYVAFQSGGSDLVPVDNNPKTDVFVHDTQTGTTVLVSVHTSGTQGDSGIYSPSISSDGRYVAFFSWDSNLVSGDDNGLSDVFLHDRDTDNNGTFDEAGNISTTRVSVVDTTGSQSTGGDSKEPSISSDGRYVAFQSEAKNLVTGDNNSNSDIFVHDTQEGETVRVSVDSNGNEGTGGGASNPAISPDGRYVAFQSLATNLDLVTADDNGLSDIFLHDRDTDNNGTFDEAGNISTTRVSVVDTTGAQATGGHSYNASISSDGRYVAFESSADNLVGSDGNGNSDIFVHDTQTGATTRVSIDSAGNEGNGYSDSPSISSDGRYVAFDSSADNLLVEVDNNGMYDIFIHDRDTDNNGTFDEAGNISTTRVSVNSSGTDGGNGHSWYPAISSDGSFVAFESGAEDLVTDDDNGQFDIFIHEFLEAAATAAPSNGSGCFIATAAYGSYWEPHVKTLRQFRDSHLLTNKAGTKFVEAYYKYSPPMADYIAEHDNLRTMARFGLAPVVGFSWLAINFGMVAALAVLFGVLTMIIGGTCLVVNKREAN